MAKAMRSKEILEIEQLAEIGSIAVESTYCEMLVESLIWTIARLDETRGKLFTHGMQMQPRLEMLSSLGKQNLDTEAKTKIFIAIISDLKENNEKRNIVIHGNWGAWYTLADLRKFGKRAKALKRRPNSPPSELEVDQLEALAVSIEAAAERLRKFAETHWRHLASP